MQSADPENTAAHGGGEALAAHRPDTEPEAPTPDTECENGLHRPSATHPAGAVPLANIALRADASTQGGAPQRDPPEARAASETREATPNTPQRTGDEGTSTSGHNRGDDSFDAFMESCRGDPHMVAAPAPPRVRKHSNQITLWAYGVGILWPHPMTMGGKTSYTVPMRHVNLSLGT